MENLIFSIEIVLPLFIVIGVGYACKRLRLIDAALTKQIMKLLFYVFLPVMLCKNVYTSSPEAILNPRVFVFAIVGMIAEFLILMIGVPKLEAEPQRRGAIIQASFRCNYAYFGIPMVESICQGQDASLAALLLVVTMPLFNIMAVVALEAHRGGKPNARKMIGKIIRNPLIIGTLLGMVILLSGIRIPSILQKPIDDISKVASPLALFLLGSSIDFSRITSHVKPLAICLLSKLVVFPAAAVALAALMGMRGVELACMLVLFGGPTAVNATVMAQQMDADSALSTEAVIFTTLFSAFTLCAFIFLMKSLGLI